MVGARKRCIPMAPTVSQDHTLSRRRRTHRRRVDGSGEREGSLQCGAACSTDSPAAMLSQACCRQRKLKCAEGASQSGKMVKVLLHGRQIPRRIQIQSWHWSCACLRRRPWPMMVSSQHRGQRRGSSSNGKAALSCVSGSAIKRITAGVKAGHRPSLPSFDLGTGLHPPDKDSLERKKNTAFRRFAPPVHLNFGRYKAVYQPISEIDPNSRTNAPPWRTCPNPARNSR